MDQPLEVEANKATAHNHNYNGNARIMFVLQQNNFTCNLLFLFFTIIEWWSGRSYEWDRISFVEKQTFILQGVTNEWQTHKKFGNEHVSRLS